MNWRKESLFYVIDLALTDDRFFPDTVEKQGRLMRRAAERLIEPVRSFKSFMMAVNKRAKGENTPPDVKERCLEFKEALKPEPEEEDGAIDKKDVLIRMLVEDLRASEDMLQALLQQQNNMLMLVTAYAMRR
jgi:hypothetical protein